MKQLIELFKKFENQWIITNRAYDKVYEADENLDILHGKAKKLQIKDAVIMFIPSAETSLAPHATN